MTFTEQLTITVIDKLVIGLMLAFTVFAFNRFLEVFKSERSLELEGFRAEQARRLEAFRGELSSSLENARNVRAAIGEVARRLAAAAHSILWLAWIARDTPKDLRLEHFQTYDKEMHELLSQIVGARVVLAAIDARIHEKIAPFADELYELDVAVSRAKSLFQTDPAEGVAALAAVHQATMEFDDNLIDAVGKISVGDRVSVVKQRGRAASATAQEARGEER